MRRLAAPHATVAVATSQLVAWGTLYYAFVGDGVALAMTALLLAGPALAFATADRDRRVDGFG